MMFLAWALLPTHHTSPTGRCLSPSGADRALRLLASTFLSFLSLKLENQMPFILPLKNLFFSFLPGRTVMILPKKLEPKAFHTQKLISFTFVQGQRGFFIRNIMTRSPRPEEESVLSNPVKIEISSRRGKEKVEFLLKKVWKSACLPLKFELNYKNNGNWSTIVELRWFETRESCTGREKFFV